MRLKLSKQQIKTIAGNIFYPLLSFAIIMAVWAIAAEVKDNPLVLPMPDVVLARFFKLGGEVGFWSGVGYTLLRTLVCFVISFVLALFFAAVSGLWKPINRVINPIVMFLRAAPTVAVILILYAFFSNNKLTVTVGFLIAFPIMYTAFYSAIVNVDKDLLEMAKLYKVKPSDKIFRIYLPSITETLFDNSRSTLSLTLKVIVAAEILTYVPLSIGENIQTANASFEVSYLLAWTLVAIVFSFVLEIAVSLAKRIWEAVR